MKIDNDKVVYFHYRLSGIGNSEGDREPLETSDSDQPAAYLHGHHNILPALEEAMAGHSAGDEFTVALSPAQAYGERREGHQQRVPIKHLLTKGRLRPGMTVKINTADGPRDARILKVGKFNVDLDLNHPFAGLELSFDIRITDVREASQEEIDHGHVHGAGGHHH
ncbi:MAG: peptidylprolyl isomerase [Bacteroidales bacterium]|nr:peptidylprolyl isomerase [Bacteroidales bacterium]